MPDQSNQHQNQINTTSVPVHNHNGLDSPQLSAANIINTTKIAASGNTFLLGNVTLAASGITTLLQSGQTITISSNETGFGGTGADGALAITSGTTTINCANAAVVVKNYTSISITGTGKLAFSNPHANGTIIVLRSQGNVTLTSSSVPLLDVSSMGAAGGAGGAVGVGSPGSSGSPGNAVVQPYIWNNDAVGGIAGSASLSGGGGAAGAAYTLPYLYVIDTKTPIWKKFGFTVTPGAGGGGGAGGESFNGGTGTQGAAGGNGGGGLYIECGGAWNFTTSGGISTGGQGGGSGAAGTAGANQVGTGGGGGGGGAGGWCVALYNTLTANTGTVTITGGTGGGGGASQVQTNTNIQAGGGGGGGSGLVAGGAGGNAANPGSRGSNGNNSKTTGAGGGTGGTGGVMNGSDPTFSAAGGGGGGGAAGEMIIAQNVFF